MNTTNANTTTTATEMTTPQPGLWTSLTVGPLYTVKYRAKTRTFDVVDNAGEIVRSFVGRGMAVNYAARIAREDQD